MRSVVFILLLATPALAVGKNAQPSDEQILTWLKELKPLPKVHYSFPLALKNFSDELLFEYARISHAISLSGEWGTSEQVDRAVKICKQVNADKPKIPASIAVNYSVWHRHFGKDLPPTDTGPTHRAELENLLASTANGRGDCVSGVASAGGHQSLDQRATANPPSPRPYRGLG